MTLYRPDGPLLAIDGARKLGFALDIWLPSGRPTSGHIELCPSGMSLGYYGVKYNDWLSETLGFHRPREVIYESPVISGNFNIEEAKKQFGMAALCETICEMHGVPCKPANNSSVKKLITGYGRAEKPEVRAQWHRRGWMIENLDESDAVAILIYKLHVDGTRPYSGPLFT